MKKLNVIDLQHLDIKQTNLLNRIAFDIRGSFNELLTSAARGNESNIDWWVSRVSSRNIFSSSLFLGCCYLVFIKRLLDEGFEISGVIVYSKGLAETLKNNFESNNISIPVYYKQELNDRLKNIFRPYYNFFCAVIHFVKLYFCALITRRLSKPLPDAPITLLDMFLFENTFKDNKMRDHYYGNILDFLEGEKEAIYYFPTFYNINNYYAAFRFMRTAKQHFFIKEDFLKIADYLYALAYPIRIMKMNMNIADFMGFDVTPLFKKERYNSMASYISMDGILNYRVAKRMKDEGISIRFIVDWFENQPIDRGISAGFRKFYNDTMVVGYQGFIASVNNIDLYPIDIENNSYVVPKQIAVIGKGLIKRFKEFCSEIDVTTAPAFRFQGLWREKKDHYNNEYNGYNVLLALPMHKEEMLNILILTSSILNRSELKNIRFLVKGHPVNTKKHIMEYYGADWPEQFEFVSGEFEECIEKASLLISSTSSVCMEALARGIPVIIVGSCSRLIFNPIPEEITTDIWRLCYSKEELLSAILCFISRDENTIKRHISIGKDILRDYFEPVTEDSVRRFLGFQ